MNASALESYCALLRKDVLDIIYQSKYGFLGSCFSCIELIVASTIGVATDYCCKPHELILSKGHAAPVLYALLLNEGTIQAKINSYATLNSTLEGHPNSILTPGIAISSGSLGIGLAIAVGRAIGRCYEKNKRPIAVIVGDGELQEGIAWEAIHAAARNKLENLVVLVDANGYQSIGKTPQCIDLPKLFLAAGFVVQEVDGHNLTEIVNAIEEIHKKKAPCAVIGKTKRGHGFEGYPPGATMSWLPTKKLYNLNIKKLQSLSQTK